MKYCLIITHEHYSWRKKPHIIFFLYSVFLFQGWTLTLRWEFCNLPQQKLLQGKFGKIITKIDPFSENQNKMKIESKAIQVRAGNTWDYFSKDNSDLGMRNWHQHGSIVEVAPKSRLHQSGALNSQGQNNSLLSSALSGPQHHPTGERNAL